MMQPAVGSMSLTPVAGQEGSSASGSWSSASLPDCCHYIEQANEALLLTDSEHCILAMNRAFGDFIGCAAHSLVGQPLSDHLLSPSALLRDEFDDRFRVQVECRHLSGERRPALLSVSRLRNAMGAVERHVIVVTDLAALLDSGRSQSTGREVYFDALTGLPNLQLVTQLIQDAIQHAERTGGDLAVCSLDLDHFKAINDRLGESAGNLLLSALAQRLSHLLGGDEVLARIGGDEFVVVMHRRAEHAFLDRLQCAIRQPILIGDQSVRMSASLGVTHYPCDAVDGEVLLRHATQAMYRAKQRGRDTYHCFDPDLDQALQVRQERRRRFAQAIDGDELRLHYQPQVDMASGEVVGVEALVRWQHPQEGLLAPGQFLPDIAGTSLEVDLGEWVLSQALCQLQAWREAGITLPVSVNISPAHLLQEAFPERLAVLLEGNPQVPARLLNLEVLETAAMHDVDTAMAVIRRCQTLGVHVAIDDFGTGFSSLTYLRQLPVDLIKIDKSFVRDMLTDPGDMAIIESIIYMANRFDRAMLAEGVESLEHARALFRVGCTLAQGFGIARPMPATHVPKWLDEWPLRQEWADLQRPIDGSHLV
ncbi:putative bifunctional diguanylate cyclase/phosphodiesterase [Billgrantia gudaonensis]|uniref:PAS domain S-box-containing protein/diguanylate cyclase (GGDEF) domain-containing protein n=1 Tax=Billgrantia gudaonensis TaxID=376427 RepID=A0A1G8T0U0_9GAMM|nr:GGDEF and EAL domain-containing protein [Halomonas gudaonensis]SDJ35063.1 PAS domain S-box-containing protein/diguanylate cyclase (GGDEF) domain-containing protein [Halomonas gudaonensis]